MMKKNFLHRNASAYKLERVVTSLLAACLYLLAGSCDKGLLERGDDDNGDTAPVALRFSTGIDPWPAVHTPTFIGDNGSDTLVRPRDVLTDYALGNDGIGLFITSVEGSELFPGSGDNLLGTYTSPQNVWQFSLKNTDVPLPPMMTKTGKNLRVLAYWPYSYAAKATGIPFDLRDVSSHIEILYNKPARQTHKINATGRMPLEFAHAYSTINIKITKTSNATVVKPSSVSLVNLSGTWIKNKGTINPATGYPNANSQAGSITDASKALSLSTSESSDYNFVAPPFMSKDVADGDVGFKIVVGNKETVFPLKRTHLNQSTKNGVILYGFAQGSINTYELVYDNLNASGKLRGWTAVSSEGEFGTSLNSGEGYNGWLFDYNDIDKNLLVLPSVNPTATPGSTVELSTKTISDHTYESYFLDMERLNNGVKSMQWVPETDPDPFYFVWNAEPPRSPIMFALKDALSIPVSWRTEDGVMVAKQVCRNYREGGYENWRLPRMSEWYMFERRIKTDKDLNFLYFPQRSGGKLLSGNLYWSGTENFYPRNVMVIRLNVSLTDVNIMGDILSPSSKAMIRCVRDALPAVPNVP